MASSEGEKGARRVSLRTQQLGGLDLDFAGGHFGIDGVLVAQADLADGGDDVLGAHLLALGVAVGGELLVEDDLGDAGAVAQVEEDEVAVVAAAVDPAHEDHLLAGVGGAQVAAEMRPFETCLRKSSTTCVLSTALAGFGEEVPPAPRAEPWSVCRWRSPSL